jgi:hypothetical protein
MYLIRAIALTVVSFVLNAPISIVAAAFWSAGHRGCPGDGNIGEGLLFLACGYVGWVVGLICYFFSTLITGSSARHRVLLVVRWVSISSLVMVLILTVLSQAMGRSQYLIVGLLFMACLSLPPQGTFWVLCAGGKLFALARKEEK